MKISPRGPYHTMHSKASYEVIEEGFDWFLLKNGTYIFKNIVEEYLDPLEEELFLDLE